VSIGAFPDEDEVDLLGVFELAARGARERVDELRDKLARVVDQHDALVELRTQALEIATQGDGLDVTGDDLFAATDGDELARARLRDLFERVTAMPLQEPLRRSGL